MQLAVADVSEERRRDLMLLEHVLQADQKSRQFRRRHDNVFDKRQRSRGTFQAVERGHHALGQCQRSSISSGSNAILASNASRRRRRMRWTICAKPSRTSAGVSPTFSTNNNASVSAGSSSSYADVRLARQSQ